MRLWYRQPAADWSDAMPLGNGRLGAMLFGGASTERILINEETVWTGGPYDPSREGAAKALPEIRRLVFAGKHREAHYLFGREMMGYALEQMRYQPVGNLLLEFGVEEPFKDYCRDLDLETAVASVEFRRVASRVRRECFVSRPAEVIVVRLESETPGSISFNARLIGGEDGKFAADGLWKAGTEGQDTLVMTGKCPSEQGIDGRVRFETIVRIRPEGGTIAAVADGIRVQDANAVTILISAATNVLAYNDVSGDADARARAFLKRTDGLDYASLKSAHIADHSSLFGRVGLELPSTAASELPTDERLKSFTRESDPQFLALYYQFGRYLLIASSRPGCVPANLQGIWNAQINPSWASKYTANINLEMNYWPAEVSGLPECVEPLIQMVEGLAQTGSFVARRHYNASGWVFHQNADLWLASAPMDGPAWGTWATGGAWLCQQLWEQYAYSRNEAVLRRIYPLLKGCAAFFLDTLVEHPQYGWLVTCPSNSPENFPAVPGNGAFMDEQLKFNMPGTTICAGPTMDMQILRDLFTHCAEAADILGTDSDLRKRWLGTRDRLAPMQVGRLGNLQEWIEDVADLEHQHRHISHLYGAFPSDQVTLEQTPALVEGVKVSLSQRGDGGTGFSMSWKAAIWARFREGSHALTCLTNLMRENTVPNLFSKCFSSPQVDGTFGACAAIAEMLLQSHGGIVRLLPALPIEWSNGLYRGLCARGGITVDCVWEGGRIQSAVLRTKVGGEVRLTAQDGRRIAAVRDRKGAAVPFRNVAGVASFTIAAGGCYDVAFEDDPSTVRLPPANAELFQTDFPPAHLSSRRAAVYDAIGAGAHALLQGASPLLGFEEFRQSNDFYYLSGIEVPQAYLLLDADRHWTTLFIPRRGGAAADHGAHFVAEDAAMIHDMTGIDEVLGLEALTARIAKARVLYVPQQAGLVAMETRDSHGKANRLVAADEWDSEPPRHARLLARLRGRFPGMDIRSLDQILDRMRSVKDARELDLMRMAGRLSALAVTEAMKLSRPGLHEYDLHALARNIYTRFGARGEGYRAIVPNGENIWYNHYMANRNVLAEGNLVLMDTAPDYHYYTSDIGRMFPVGGRYNAWQRELYGFVIEYHKTLLARLRPGVTAAQVLEESAGVMGAWLEGHRLSAGAYRRAAQEMLKRPGLLSHAVGMAVHDPCSYKDRPLEPGMVFAVDPEYWVPEDRLYIRVEDTVVITDAGIENLTAAAPLEMDDVERTMAEPSRFDFELPAIR